MREGLDERDYIVCWTRASMVVTINKEVIKDHVTLWSSSLEQKKSLKCVVTVTSVLVELGLTALLIYTSPLFIENEQGIKPLKV